MVFIMLNTLLNLGCISHLQLNMPKVIAALYEIGPLDVHGLSEATGITDCVLNSGVKGLLGRAITKGLIRVVGKNNNCRIYDLCDDTKLKLQNVLNDI